MGEADYREISQQYAQGAIKATILINGGAAVAVLSQLKDLSDVIPQSMVGWAMICFEFGVVLGATAWLIAFISTSHVDRTLRGQNTDYSSADFWMHAGILSVVLAILVFMVGCLLLSVSFICAGLAP